MRNIREIWYSLPIRTKLMVFFSIIIVCISSLNIYTLSNAYRYTDLYGEEIRKTYRIYDLETRLIQSSNSFEEYLTTDSPSDLDDYGLSLSQLWTAWDAVLETSGNNQDALFQIEAIRYAFRAYNKVIRDVLNYRETSEEEFRASLLKSRRIIGYIENYEKELIRIRLRESSRVHLLQVEKVNTVRFVSFIIIVGIAVFLLFFGILFSEGVTRPIRRLADRSSLMAEGKLTSQEVPSGYNDEIGVLTRSFNLMSRNIHEMIKSLKGKVEIEKQLRKDEVKIIEMDRSLREAQFISLQSQIRPHFLFNTLNVISRTALFEKASETSKLIESLSRIFRYTLKEQNLMVSLEDEFQIIEEYMHIQQSRYGDRVKFITDFNLPLSEIKVPIFTLQPLVENAIKYGIEPKEEGGLITLSVKKEGSNVVILLSDDGMGMTPQSINEAFCTQKAIGISKSTGIGLCNVRRRLDLAFFNKDCFEIVSQEGKGTTIKIVIPENENCIEF